MKAIYWNGLTLKTIEESDYQKYLAQGNEDIGEEPCCSAIDRNGFLCTRNKRHDGCHVACGEEADGTITVIAVWEDQDESR